MLECFSWKLVCWFLPAADKPKTANIVCVFVGPSSSLYYGNLLAQPKLDVSVLSFCVFSRYLTCEELIEASHQLISMLACWTHKQTHMPPSRILFPYVLCSVGDQWDIYFLGKCHLNCFNWIKKILLCLCTIHVICDTDVIELFCILTELL